MTPRPTRRCLLLLAAAATSSARGLSPPPKPPPLKPPPLMPRRLYMDWVALNSKATARHIMRPPTTAGRAECLQIKQELSAATAAGEFVVDAFSAAAATHSLDEESRPNGGLLGVRLRQGVCRLPELDRACFCSPLGRVTGPLQTSQGVHLLLVEERIGLQMHDAGMSRVVAQPRQEGGVRSVLAPPDPDEAGDGPELLLSLLGLAVVSVAGGQLIGAMASAVDLGAMASAVR
mmetsp:Transcript_30475/g.100864  ORF Transcript_30475/g.100864 Transcript_30475/m.100864 type:complete len:233 (-) Transcript_30475:148-846(-)